jgi:hypothetical protein
MNETNNQASGVSRDLLSKRLVDTPEDSARALLWAMSEMVPWDAPHPKAGQYLFRSERDMAEVWRSQGGDAAKFPQSDFEKFMVLALFMDEGEYHQCMAPKSVLVLDSRIVVVVGQSSTPWKMINPMSVIRFPRCEGEVVFQEDNEDHGAAAPCSQHTATAPVELKQAFKQRRMREDAITQLRSLGLHAHARDWALGETISVWKNERPMGELTAIDDPAVIYPTGGRWAVWWQQRQGRLPEPQFNTLADAVNHVVSHYFRREDLTEPIE